jgi:AAA family ATP:ADP antiporter
MDAFRLEKGERLLTLLLFLWFFLTLCSYYVVRPVRSAMVLFTLGPEALPWAYMGTAAATGIAVWLFARFSKARRCRLVGGTLALLVASLAAWWWVVDKATDARAAGSTAWDWTSPVFYVWIDVFSSLAVTLFWMVANDLFGPHGAKRSFVILAAAGPAGGVAGAWLAEMLAHPLGPAHLILVSAGLFAAVFVIFLAVEALSGGRSAARPHPAAAAATGAAPADLRKLPDVLRTVGRSRLLLMLVFVVGFERVAPDFVDWIFQAAGKQAVDDHTAWTAFFAAFDKWREVAVLVATFFVTPPLLAWRGPAAALATVPLAIVLFAGGFAIWPVFYLAVLMKGFEEGQRHAWFKAGKELTYTVTSREVIYSIKGYVEVFLYRFARGVAGAVLLLLTAGLGWGPAGVAVAVIPLCLAWLWCIRELGREFHRQESSPQTDSK